MRIADLPKHRQAEARAQLHAATAPVRLLAPAPAPRVVRLTLPFALLVPDNRRTGGVIDGRVWTSKRYRHGKQAVHTFSLTALHAAARPVFPAGGVALVADVWLPDRRRRDLVNLCKGLHDALEGVVYADDTQLVDVHYRRAGLDRSAPRVELVFTLTPGDAP